MALQITGLSKTYPNGVRPEESIADRRHNMFGLLGPNGPARVH
jgi:hypothetical protein